MKIEQTSNIGKRLIGLVACLLLTSICALPAQAQILTTEDLRQHLAALEQATEQAEAKNIPAEQAGLLYSQLGSLYQDAGMYVPAENAFEQAMHKLTVAPVNQQALAKNIDNLGSLYMEMGNLKEAERAEQKALKMREALPATPEVATSWYHLALTYTREHNEKQATAYAQQAVDGLSSNANATPEERVGSLVVLGYLLCHAHEYANAIEKLNTARQVIALNYPPNSFPAGLGEFLLGYADWKAGDVNSAGTLMQHGTEMIDTQLGEKHPACLPIMLQYERFLRQTHQKAAARSLEQRVERVRSQLAQNPAYSHSLTTVDIAALF
jgi:tetratricopeptide (TPR) repeat protein